MTTLRKTYVICPIETARGNTAPDCTVHIDRERDISWSRDIFTYSAPGHYFSVPVPIWHLCVQSGLKKLCLNPVKTSIHIHMWPKLQILCNRSPLSSPHRAPKAHSKLPDLATIIGPKRLLDLLIGRKDSVDSVLENIVVWSYWNCWTFQLPLKKMLPQIVGRSPYKSRESRHILLSANL